MIKKPLEDWTPEDWQNALKEQAIKEAMKPPIKFHWAEVVVVNQIQIGVIVKCWENITKGTNYYEVYVRSLNSIIEFHENQIQKFIWNKELSEDDLQYYA